jgi:predicted DNA-binding transcriptional regulator AlpA
VSKTGTLHSDTGQRATTVLDGKRLLDETEFDLAYGVPVKTLRGMRLRGSGPVFLKLGSSVRYRVSDIEAWLDRLPRGGAGVPSSAVKGA